MCKFYRHFHFNVVFNTESPTHWDTASRVTFPRTFINKIIPCNFFVLQPVRAVLAQISALQVICLACIGYFCKRHTRLSCLLFANAKEIISPINSIFPLFIVTQSLCSLSFYVKGKPAGCIHIYVLTLILPAS